MVLSGAGWVARNCAELAQKLRDFSGIKAVAPSPNLRAVLRLINRAGWIWLQFLREYSLGGILADDMGLGKTVQAIAHLLHGTRKWPREASEPCRGADESHDELAAGSPNASRLA